MRKFFVTIVFAFAFLITASPAGAVGDLNIAASPSPNFRTNLKSNIDEMVQKKLDSKKTEVREKAATRAADFREKRKGIIRDRLTKVLTHLDGVVQRLDAIAEKIQARIARLDEKGVDVTQMQVALDGCAATKSAFATAVSDAKTKVSTITDNGEADGSARAALASVKSAFESGKSHHKCLVGVIVMLRASKPAEETENAN